MRLIEKDGADAGIKRSILMCEAWHGSKPTDVHTVDHIISSDKCNDSADNLRWATRREQMLNRRTGVKPLADKIARGRPVVSSALDGAIVRHSNRRQANIFHGKHKKNQAISSAIKSGGTAFGLKWMFADIAVDEPGEIWRLFASGLWISSHGRIKDINQGFHVLIHSPRQGQRVVSKINGYFWFNWKRDDELQNAGVGDIVLPTFYRVRVDDEQVDHRNGNRTDNSLINLEWVTPLANSQRRDMLARGEQIPPTTTPQVELAADIGIVMNDD
jgi:hypothetical protein